MAENKTKATGVDPQEFIDKVDGEEKRKDAEELLRLMSKVTGKPPRMWGPTIIGFGKYHYKSRERARRGDLHDGLLTAKARPCSLSRPGSKTRVASRLGKHKVGKGCLYINKLADVDRVVLKELVVKAVAEMRKRYDCD